MLQIFYAHIWGMGDTPSNAQDLFLGPHSISAGSDLRTIWDTKDGELSARQVFYLLYYHPNPLHTLLLTLEFFGHLRGNFMSDTCQLLPTTLDNSQKTICSHTIVPLLGVPLPCKVLLILLIYLYSPHSAQVLSPQGNLPTHNT